jgi:sugar phosphate isomerase/epimerase
MEIQLGCFTRPWREFGVEAAAAGMRAAGFKYFGPMSMGPTRLIDYDSTPEELAAIERTVKGADLQFAIMMATYPLTSVEAGVAALNRELDCVEQLGFRHVMTGGASNPAQYDTYYAIMRECAEYAMHKGITLMLKPHGGLSNTTRETIESWKKVNHQNFKICYDAGNLLYYAGEDPLAHIREIAPIVAGMCIKDEVGGQKGDVMVTPGDGLVDFPAVFTALKDAGFAGPCVVECLSGEALDEVNHQAVRARHFLEDTLSNVGYTVD